MDRDEKRINEEIRASTVEVISAEGEPLGVMPLSRALALAEEAELDLVELSTKDGVVITRLMDYGKYLFKKQKTQNKNRVQSKQAELKTLRLTYAIGDHDMEIRRVQARKFAEHRNPIKVVLQLRGRQNQFDNLAAEKLQAFIDSLADVYKPEGPVSKTGKVLSVLLQPGTAKR